jgi:hypothetical protein
MFFCVWEQKEILFISQRVSNCYLGQFDTNYIIFRDVEKFQKLFFPNKKNIVKDNSEYLGIFHLLK